MALADALKNIRLDKFRIKSKDAIGVDLGSTALKIVQLKGAGGRWKVHRANVLPLPNAGPDVAGPERRVQAISLLKEYVAKQKDSISKNAVFSVSGNSVIVRFVKFPKMSRDDLSKMIVIEAEPYIPFAIPEVNIDFNILGDTVEEGQKKMETILVAAKKEIINGRLEIIQQSGMTPSLIDVDAFALQNAYELNVGANAKETALLVHIGAFVTTMTIIESGVPKVVRDVFIAGNTVTKALQRNFQVDAKKADDMKAKAVILATQEEREKAMADQNKEVLQMSTVILPVMKDLLAEIQRSLDFYLSQGTDRQVTRVLLSGGTSRLGNLVNYLAQELRLPVEMFDPFARIDGAQSIAPDMRPLFAVAVGLALRREGDIV
ncbi:MAG TPA: type IV pilus assembly protein PilM [Elusimicrobiota bacterium]|nr:type IV pilus assembly protein PilM [Elusimicrobiota bacterium]HND64089.1 type IV pilus assembly protein PilM [Elusimicrobiota bacterium]HNI57319.1 type IV pilus assembly protein PilM [Elusimicrobiota bacterium]